MINSKGRGFPNSSPKFRSHVLNKKHCTEQQLPVSGPVKSILFEQSEGDSHVIRGHAIFFNLYDLISCPLLVLFYCYLF